MEVARCPDGEALLPHPLPPDAEQLAVEQEGLKELGEGWDDDVIMISSCSFNQFLAIKQWL